MIPSGSESGHDVEIDALLILKFNWPSHMTGIILVILFAITPFVILAQDTLMLQKHTIEQQTSGLIFQDHSFSFKEAEALSKSGISHFRISKKVIERSSKEYWLTFFVKNVESTPLAMHMDAFMKEAYIDGKPIDFCSALPCETSTIPAVPKPYSTNISITPGTHSILLKIGHYDLPVNINARISSVSALHGATNLFDSCFFLLIATFMGAVLLLSSLALTIFTIGRDKAFLWYGLFCCFLGLNSLRILTEHYVFLNNNPLYISFIYFKHFSAVALYMTYALFASSFINAYPGKPLVYKTFRIFVFICLLSIIPEIILLISGRFEISFYYYFIARNILGICSVILILLVYKYRREVFVQFFLAGSTILVTAEMVSNFLPKGYDSMVGTLGAFLELGVFAAGLGYRVRLYYVTRLKLLNENMEKNRIIADLQIEKSKLNMSILQSQMNPHFIFNSLNSINRYILKKNKNEASYYLSRFSKLMRLILDNSMETSITLSDELDSLKIYLELEAQRFSGTFEYRIEITDEVEIEKVLVPPLILQPFVENSIKHGFVHRTGKERVEIQISKSDTGIRILIIDNGIGRAAAKLISGDKESFHKSKGIQITIDRIRNFRLITGQNSSVEYKDLGLAGEQGTIVEMIL